MTPSSLKLERQLESALNWLNSLQPEPWLFGDTLTQADITCAVAFTFLREKQQISLREGDYPSLDRHCDYCETLPSFKSSPYSAKEASQSGWKPRNIQPAPIRAMIRVSGMRNLALYVILLLATGCSTGIVVHDEDRAAELVVDFLSALKSAKGIQAAYDWTDDKFKEKVSFIEFSQMVSSIRKLNQGADIRLAGYEIFGPVEIIIVYANSVVSRGKTFFKLVLVGSKSGDYYLLDLDINDSGFSKEGIYNDYDRAILIEGV